MTSRKNPFEEFLERYANDPVLFVREVFGVEPDQWQTDLMTAVASGERRIAVRSGHGVGKTTVLAWLIVWHLLVKFPQKTVCTAPTKGQLFDALAAETEAWWNKLPAPIKEFIEVKTESIEHKFAPAESFVSFRTSRPETPEALAGIHSENVLLIADEASGIPEQVFEAAVGSMSGHNAVTILTGNPVRTSGLFFDIFNKPSLQGKWLKFHVSCYDCKRVSQDFIDQVADTYGIDSNAFRVRVLGEFPTADDDTVIPFELMEMALQRDVAPLNVKPVWGLDVARFGSDRTSLTKRKGNVLLEKTKWWAGLDTMQVAGRVKLEWDSTPSNEKPTDICVDAIGLGAGVADRLREMGLPARAVNVSESPSLKEQYRNLRAELYWKAREWFAKRDCNLANDIDLGNELIKVKYKIPTSGKLQIEGKDEMKKRGMRSPDLADSFILTFAVEAISALHGNSMRTSWKVPLKRALKGIA